MKSFKSRPVYFAVMAALAMPAIGHAAETSNADATDTLPEVAVSADTIKQSSDVDGYQAKKTTTATKTETLLRDVPQSISVVTQDQIEDQSIQSIAEAVRYVPGVGATQGEGNRDAIVFRGNQSTSDLFVDGIRDDVQYYRDFYNIERIEVLKGPNGMIFGRGGAGGVINRVSKEAGWDPIRELTINAGSYDNKRVAIDVGQGINEVAAFRLNAMYEDSESYRDGVELERSGINPTLTFLPTEQTKVVLSAEYFNDERVADRGIPSFDGRPFDTDESTFFGNADLSPTETTVQAYGALIEHAFDNGVTIRNRTRYADYDKYYQNVFAASPVVGGQLDLEGYRDDTQRQNLFNQTDLLFTVNTGTVQHRMLAGTEFGRQENENFRFDATFNGNDSDTVFAGDPISREAVAFNTLNRRSKTDIDVTAFYLQDQIILTQKWQAVFGLRYDKFETDFRDIKNNNQIDTTDEFVSPRAGLIYKPIEPVSIYANYSQAYVPRAGEQLASISNRTKAFDPEEFKNYEIGAKWDVNPALALTAAVYKLERSNIAINDPNDANVSILIDGQDTKGVELGAAGQVTSAWSVFGGYAYQEAEVTRDQSATITAGNVLPNTPEQTLSFWNRYDFNETWGAAIGVISREHTFAAADNQVRLPGYTRVDAAVFAQLNKNTRLQLNIENLLDKEYFLYAHNNNNITPGSPVAARATLIMNF